MEKKVKDAFKKAGIELPAKQENPVAKESKNNHSSTKPINSKQRKADQSVRNKQSNKEVSKNTRGVKTRKQKNPKRNTQAKYFDDGLPSWAVIRDAYGSSSKDNPENNRDKSQTPERTFLKAKEGFHFEQNPIFNQKGGDSHRAIIDERPCVTQISPGSDIEVQLVIGLDLGTSMTKVIIGDPDQKRFYAVPLSPGSENPYLISTSIIKDQLHNIIIDTGDSPNALRNIKLDLMEKRSNVGF